MKQLKDAIHEALMVVQENRLWLSDNSMKALTDFLQDTKQEGIREEARREILQEVKEVIESLPSEKRHWWGDKNSNGSEDIISKTALLNKLK